MFWNEVVDKIMMNEYAKYRNGLKRKENIMKEFTKQDLQNGDVVKIRDGSIGIAIPDKNIIIFGTTGYNVLNEYNDDMTFVAKQDDIIAVRRPERPVQCTFGGYYDDKGELVYERKEVEEMTLEEVCKALGKEIKIVKSKGEWVMGTGSESLF